MGNNCNCVKGEGLQEQMDLRNETKAVPVIEKAVEEHEKGFEREESEVKEEEAEELPDINDPEIIAATLKIQVYIPLYKTYISHVFVERTQEKR